MTAALLLPILLAVSAPDQAGPGAAAAQPTVTRQAEQPWPPPGISRVGNGVTAPRLIKEEKPRYPSQAREAGIGGTVSLEAVVDATGKVGEVRVVRSLDTQYGLDDEAVKAVKAWRFSPGTKDGVAVPVLVDVEMSFSVRR